ncbi:hypothetical protein EYF80_029349 [Liparis tanakae]|uniref:Uncharacterized protein n=1 Tax=Liparis tanakae TaxID=230148 RepID=A0A4Z2H3S8_9TELE|nr:hypothetical protein EYF80_029349 [Liparis tanakae]
MLSRTDAFWIHGSWDATPKPDSRPATHEVLPGQEGGGWSAFYLLSSPVSAATDLPHHGHQGALKPQRHTLLHRGSPLRVLGVLGVLGVQGAHLGDAQCEAVELQTSCCSVSLAVGPLPGERASTQQDGRLTVFRGH